LSYLNGALCGDDGNAESLVECGFKQHVARQIEVRPALKQDAGQTDPRSNGSSVSSAFNSSSHGTKDGTLQSPLSHDRNTPAVAGFTF
jgi:hypothetical protein